MIIITVSYRTPGSRLKDLMMMMMMMEKMIMMMIVMMIWMITLVIIMDCDDMAMILLMIMMTICVSMANRKGGQNPSWRKPLHPAGFRPVVSVFLDDVGCLVLVRMV